MLKRRANHRAPPQPAVRRRVGLAARAAACPTVVDTTTAAWRRASCLAERERAALEHYEQLGRQAQERNEELEWRLGLGTRSVA